MIEIKICVERDSYNSYSDDLVLSCYNGIMSFKLPDGREISVKTLEIKRALAAIKAYEE